MGLKWHVKWDSLVIKVSFKCKLGCTEAYSISLILNVRMHQLTTKAFPSFPSSSSIQHTSLSTSHPVSQCARKKQRLLVLQWHLWIYMRSCVILWMVLLLPERQHTVWCSSLPPLSLALRCLEYERRSTSAPLLSTVRPVHPPADSSRCWSPCYGTPWCLPSTWGKKKTERKIP